MCDWVLVGGYSTKKYDPKWRSMKSRVVEVVRLPYQKIRPKMEFHAE